jgi:hypothetical protein
MNVDQQMAALIAERSATVQRLLSLRGVMHAGLLARKQPQKIEKLQTEVLALCARVRVINQTIEQHFPCRLTCNTNPRLPRPHRLDARC